MEAINFKLEDLMFMFHKAPFNSLAATQFQLTIKDQVTVSHSEMSLVHANSVTVMLIPTTSMQLLILLPLSKLMKALLCSMLMELKLLDSLSLIERTNIMENGLVENSNFNFLTLELDSKLLMVTLPWKDAILTHSSSLFLITVTLCSEFQYQLKCFARSTMTKSSYIPS